MYIRGMSAVPKSAGMKRQPSELKPKSWMPSAMISLASGGSGSK